MTAKEANKMRMVLRWHAGFATQDPAAKTKDKAKEQAKQKANAEPAYRARSSNTRFIESGVTPQKASVFRTFGLRLAEKILEQSIKFLRWQERVANK